jgi:hypothetical protein
MLTIKDLSASKELDRAAMATVRGGTMAVPGDTQNSFNLFDIYNTTDYRPDYSTDIIAQLNVGDINANNNFGSVVIPQLAQANDGSNS